MQEEVNEVGNLASRLTRREQSILQLLIKGYTNQEIADALNIHCNTVKNAVGSVLQKLGARHRTEAAIFGIRERERERNELIRKIIIQVCASCPRFKRVKKWLKELEELEEMQKQEVN